MQNAVEIPVSEELKEKYIQSLDMLDFTVYRAFDPNRQYKIITVPKNMKYNIFQKIVSQDFHIGEFDSMLLDMTGSQVPLCSTVDDLYKRNGDQFQISNFQYAIQYDKD